MKRILLPLCGLVLAMSSCSENDPIDTTAASSAVALELTASGINSGDLSISDRVGLYFGDEYKNVEYAVSSSGEMSVVAEQIMMSSSAQQSLFGYYPYDSERISSLYSFDVSDQSSVSDEFLWATKSSSNSTFELDFSHIYSSVYLNISNIDDLDLVCSTKGMTTSGSFDLASGQIEGGATTAANFSLSIENGEAVAVLKLMPETDISKLAFEFTSPTSDYYYIYYPVVSGDSEWVSSGIYSYDVALLQGTYIPVTGISLNQNTLELTETYSETLTATINPDNATNKSVVWTTSNSSVALVSDSGVVSAVGEGQATITVMAVDGSYTDSCLVDVEIYSPTLAESIELNMDNKTVERGVALLFEATIYPEETFNKNVSWSSNNPSVASIDSNGRLAVRTEGQTTVTATSMGNQSVSKSVVITVSGGNGLAVGDYVYTSGNYLYSSEYDSSGDILGVVYSVTGDLTGKLVNMGVSSALYYMAGEISSNYLVGAQDFCNGLFNTRTIVEHAAEQGLSLSSFPLINYVNSLNTAAGIDPAGYADDATNVWYLPAEYELSYTPTTTADSSIEDFPSNFEYGLWYAVYGTDHTATSVVNTQMTKAGGTAFTTGLEYASSREVSASNYRCTSFSTSSKAPLTYGYSKVGKSKNARAIMNVDLNY